MAQHEVTKPVELLDEKGHIIEEGWARQMYWKYDRDKIKAPWFRKKEWTYSTCSRTAGNTASA